MMDFDEIVGDLDDIEPPEDCEDYTQLTDLQLMDKFNDYKADLMDRGVALQPVDPSDMEKQSVYLGLAGEMRRRKLI